MKSETLIKIERNKRKYFESVFVDRKNSSGIVSPPPPTVNKPARDFILGVALQEAVMRSRRKILTPVSDRWQEIYLSTSSAVQQKTSHFRSRVYSFLEVLFDA